MIDPVCPDCLSGLVEQDHTLICSGCDSHWNIGEDNIPDLARREFWWNQISREDTGKILAMAGRKGWQTALSDGLLPVTDDYTYRYALLESRADWHFLLGLEPKAKVLDIGCGWGPVTIQLARHYAEVHGVDTNMLTLRFVDMRAKQEGLKNIVLARIDPLEWSHLPYLDGSFDLVVLNGILEWVGAARYDSSPEAYQRRTMLEIRRILKPGGLAYVGIENRFAYSHFLGDRSHSGVRFADLLPRPLADMLCRIQGKDAGFRTYLYSLKGYQKLFSDCGFVTRETLLAHPDYRFPDFLIPLSGTHFLSYWANAHFSGWSSCLLRIAILLQAAPLFAYSYSMIIESGSSVWPS